MCMCVAGVIVVSAAVHEARCLAKKDNNSSETYVKVHSHMMP